MTIPSQVMPGDTLSWLTDEATTPRGEPIRSSEGWALTTYVRFPVATGGASAAGVASGTGWDSTISAGLTSLFPAGQRGSWQSVASKAGESYTIGQGTFDVLTSLAAAGAVDNRSQARKSLDACQQAIRNSMEKGGMQEYRIGTRTKKLYTLTELMALESQLKAEVAREEAAQSIANGGGNPYNLFVRFG